eukprot:NODE_2558_length_772_cov_278.417704_g1788_i0.p1 GENE.NODE_2558_length_772_cov_278.417704_g1788_i0~~NODE_2558_length_772_cov_278.417704_g1788_i0.p1  ORF type:complete len:220 (-),score=72.86 NODE_2558_length_772_cov_278.417704_g1788_i0:83-742(-)
MGGKNLARAQKDLPGKITWIWSAVSNYRGNATFWGYSGMGRLLDSKDANATTNPKNWNKDFRSSQRMTVRVSLLDDLIDQKPYIIKIDVEGAELKVFEGAKRLMATRPPIIIVEFNPSMMLWSQKDNGYDLLALLHSYGYDLYDSAVSEPMRRGFLSKYDHHRPTDYKEYVDWLLKSREFDKWGSWTDIIAVLPPGTVMPDGKVWPGMVFEYNGNQHVV